MKDRRNATQEGSGTMERSKEVESAIVTAF